MRVCLCRLLPGSLSHSEGLVRLQGLQGEPCRHQGTSHKTEQKCHNHVHTSYHKILPLSGLKIPRECTGARGLPGGLQFSDQCEQPQLKHPGGVGGAVGRAGRASDRCCLRRPLSGRRNRHPLRTLGQIPLPQCAKPFLSPHVRIPWILMRARLIYVRLPANEC